MIMIGRKFIRLFNRIEVGELSHYRWPFYENLRLVGWKSVGLVKVYLAWRSKRG